MDKGSKEAGHLGIAGPRSERGSQLRLRLIAPPLLQCCSHFRGRGSHEQPMGARPQPASSSLLSDDRLAGGFRTPSCAPQTGKSGVSSRRELERLLGRKTMEVEILKEALDLARAKKTDLAVVLAAAGK
jgi:hypothetical protein